MVGVGGETAIKLEFGAASRLAAGECRKIEIWETHGFFELVDPIAGKKHLRHVGLVTGDLGHGRPIGVAPAQEFDLVSERRLCRGNRLWFGAGWVLLEQHEATIKLVAARSQLIRINPSFRTGG